MAVIDAYYTYKHNTFRVWQADALGQGWDAVPYLRVDSLSMVAAPDVDQCTLSYVTGQFVAREGDEFGSDPITAPEWFDALDLNRKYVRVELLDRNNIDETTDEPAVLLTWFGVVEIDEREEAQQADEDEHRTGRQTLTAYGLLRLLETATIAKSVVKKPAGAVTQTVFRGLPFNFNSRSGLMRRGNRTRLELDGVFVFDFLPAKDDDPETEDHFWSASDAVQYVLKHHAPVDENDVPICDWVAEPLTAGKLPIDFYEITVETDRRTVKEVLDDLVDRRRMVGYYVYGREPDPEALTFEAVLKVFTLTAEDIDVETGTIPANPEQESLIAGSSPTVSSVRVRKIATHQVDRIYVEGAYITSTFTLGVGENDAGVTELVKGWTDEQEDDYRDAAGGTAQENSVSRCRDALRDVFSRFLIDTDWPATVEYNGDEYYVAVTSVQLFSHNRVDAEDVRQTFLKTEDNADLQGALAFHTRRFLDLIPFRDEQTNEFRRPFVVMAEGAAGAPDTLWAYAENVSALNPDRKFNCSTRFLQDRPGVVLEVNRAAGQQLIGKDHWEGAATTEVDLDPAEAEGLNYENLRLTATLEWDLTLNYRLHIGTDDGARRTIYIWIPDARLDFVLPGTVEDISSSGELTINPGQVVNDDYSRLRKIGRAAEAWYRQERQAMAITYRELHAKLEIGTLITQLWGVSDDPIHTPVTGIRLDGLRGTTTIETAYAEIDFASLASSGSKFKNARGRR